jgi:diguanylate cyclase (GGDEF)-like protein
MHLLNLILKASGNQGVPKGGVISPLFSNIYLNEVDRMLARAKEVTAKSGYTAVEYARFADDIVVLLSELATDFATSRSQAAIVADTVRMKLGEPYLLSGKHGRQANSTIEHHCTASIGVALFFDHEASEDDILKWADDAMYRAMEAGRNRIRFYEAKQPA